MSIKHQLLLELTKVAKQLGIDDVEPIISYPPDGRGGDYSTNFAMVAGKKLGRNPMEVAEDVRIKIKDLGLIKKIEVVAPGFINFWIADESLLSVIASPH